jgi:ABC-type nitrate/sulfonate/bicarbonate transport system ATPase subunit
MPVSLGGNNKAMKLTVHDLEKRFTVRKSIVQALLPISFEVGNNEFVSLLGPSGCGKTTTLYLIAGLEQPSSGEILLDDRLIRGPGADRGMVFQGYTLFPWLTVIENATFAHRLPRNMNYSMTTREVMHHIGRAHSLLDLMGLREFHQSYPRELSGGMKQRVAIVRALANKPKLLLMDEPFGALDAQTREEMQELILLLHAHENTTILFVTHDIDEALFLSTRILVFSARPGRIVRDMRVPFGPIRSLDLKVSPEFLTLKRDLFDLLHQGRRPLTDRASLLNKIVNLPSLEEPPTIDKRAS